MSVVSVDLLFCRDSTTIKILIINQEIIFFYFFSLLPFHPAFTDIKIVNLPGNIVNIWYKQVFHQSIRMKTNNRKSQIKPSVDLQQMSYRSFPDNLSIKTASISFANSWQVAKGSSVYTARIIPSLSVINIRGMVWEAKSEKTASSFWAEKGKVNECFSQ